MDTNKLDKARRERSESRQKKFQAMNEGEKEAFLQ
jgi:hypothetical protein